MVCQWLDSGVGARLFRSLKLDPSNYLSVRTRCNPESLVFHDIASPTWLSFTFFMRPPIHHRNGESEARQIIHVDPDSARKADKNGRMTYFNWNVRNHFAIDLCIRARHGTNGHNITYHNTINIGAKISMSLANWIEHSSALSSIFYES